MDCVIAALERVFAEGREICICADDQPRIQDWLVRREEAFMQLNRVSAQLAEAEKTIAVGLIEAIRQLDASIISRFQDRLNDLSDEFAAARKLKGFLGAGGAAERPAIFRRAV
jgi:hypothetical protein